MNIRVLFAARVLAIVVVVVAMCSTAVGAAANADVEKQRKWYQQHVVDAYDEVGKRDAQWDDAARTMLAAYARLHASEHTPTHDEDDVIYHQSVITRKQKCDDPLVTYVTARNMEFWNRDADAARLALPTAESMQASGYHPVHKCRALLRAAQLTSTSKQAIGDALAEARKLMDRALEHIPAIAADADVPRGVLFLLMDAIGDASKDVTGDRQTYAAKAFKLLDANCKDRSLVLAVMGRFYVEYAWDARGNGFAAFVKDENFKLMAERLKPAAVAAEEAWALDNNNVHPCLVMLQVELGQAEGRARMEQWYQRAIAADPASLSARGRKMLYLEPKWYGDGLKDLFAFARECRDTGDWENGVPLLLVDAHLKAARYTAEGFQQQPSPAYFRDNPQAWADVKQVYDEYLKRVPDSRYHRSRYAQIAAWAGQWAEADQQFKAMGDRFSYSYFRNSTRYRAVRAEVEAKLAAAGAQ